MATQAYSDIQKGGISAFLTGGGSNVGQATIDFGSTPTDNGSIAVTGQGGIIASSTVNAWLVGDATGDNDAEQHRIAAASLRLVVTNLVAGAGFTIDAQALFGAVIGTFLIRWSWS